MSEATEISSDQATDTDDSGRVPAAEDGPQPTAGQILKAARETAGLTVAEVAQSLKFSARQIEALEADDYLSLPGNTIVRGFVRSYARLLRLEPESLLLLLDQRSPNAPADVRPPDNMGIASEEGGLRQLTPVASGAIIIGLAALLLGLWHFFGPALTKPAPGPGNGQAARVAPPENPVAQDVPPAGPVAPVAAVAAPEAGAPTQVNVQGDTAAGPKLLFVFEDRSWLEVTDADQQVLHSGENPAGSQLTLSGRPPFDIVIGNAGKVKLTYGERMIDLAPHTRAEVARLKLE